MIENIQREGTLTLPSDQEILMQRVFRTTARKLFDMWTIPEHVREWYGVRSSTVTVCEIDLRIGGSWRWVIVTPTGMEVVFSGEFTEIDAPYRFVRTERYEAIPGGEPAVVTFLFQEDNGYTTLSMRMRFPDKAGRDMCLRSGMELGVREIYLNLDRLLERD